MFKKFLIILFVVIPFNSFALEKETTFDKEFLKQSEGSCKFLDKVLLFMC